MKIMKGIIGRGILSILILIYSSVFAWSDYTWTTIDYPGAIQTDLYGISGSNIVGYGYNTPGGFIYNGSVWTTLNYPGAMWTAPHAISGSNIVGIYYNDFVGSRSFLYDGSTWTILDCPGATEGTYAWGISNGSIVGYYLTPPSGRS